MHQQVKATAQQWLDGNYDEQTRQQVRHLLENDPAELVECFYRELEFGTGGLRGIMGVGTNRMNIYTVGKATQGLCNYLKASFPGQPLSAAVAHDCRNNSPLFARTVAQIFAANGIKAYLFDELRPTPELSFAIRHFGCQTGVVITASHNPKEYNGFKAYWNDGGQVTEPHDQNIVDEALRLTNADIRFEGNPELVASVGKEVDQTYLALLKELSLNPETIARQKDMKIVFTPIHGTGVRLVPQVLAAYGFENVFNVPEQDIVDGDFPTVVSPNPENAEALRMALEKADAVGADLVMATDPDSDRVGIAVRDDKGRLVLLNGNQTGALLIHYLVTQWEAKGMLQGKEYVVKTIVTTELIHEIARKHGVEHHDVLTGFKYIAEIIKANHGHKRFIGGGEESYGYLAGEFVRDKDAIMSCALIAEAAAFAREQGRTLYEQLLDIYVHYGCYREDLVNLTKKGKAGAEEIQQMMAGYRQQPPAELGGSPVVMLKDYHSREARDLRDGSRSPIDLPSSNVLQFFTADGGKISVRPSGTEPKIKFYVSVREDLATAGQFPQVWEKLAAKIEGIRKSLGL